MRSHPKYHPNWKHPIENRADALEAVRFNSCFLENVHESLRADKEIVLIAVSHRWVDYTVLQTAWMKENPFGAGFYQKDLDFVFDAYRPSESGPLKWASQELKDDFDVVFAAAKAWGFSIQEASLRLQANRDIALAAVKENGLALSLLNEEWRNDKEIVLAAVTNKNDSNIFIVDVLGCASQNLKDDYEVVLAAVRYQGRQIEGASIRLQHDRGIALEAVNNDGSSLEFLSASLRDDRDVVSRAVSHVGHALEFASDRLKNDKEIVRLAIRDHTNNIRFASKKIRFLWELNLFK